MPTLLLIRHGRSTANTAGVLAGWAPGVALDDEGRAQAIALGERLREMPVRLLAVSPLQRCQETADAVTAAAGWGEVRRVQADALGECHYGAWTDRPLAELAADPLWRTVQDHPSAAVFPPSEQHAHESLAQMSARAVRAVRELDALVAAEHGADAVWALVSHGDVVKAILADAAGTHLDLFQRFVVGPASLSVVQYTAQRPFLLRLNDRGGLGDVVPAPRPAADESSDADGAQGTDGGAGTGDATVGGATR